MQMGYLMRKNIRRFLLNGLLKEKHHLTSQQCQPKFILQHVCSLQDLGLFSSGDQREILWIFVFLSCLFSVCTWHHIRFNFMNGLEGQASLISCGNGACKALGPSGSVPCWWGVCSASPARPARLCLRGEVWLRPPRAERGEAALVRALQGMAGDHAAALAACCAEFCPSNGAVLLLCSLLRCPKHSEGISVVMIAWACVSVFLSAEKAHQLLLQNQF